MGNPNAAVGEMIRKPFFDWIIRQRDKRGWNDAELSSAAGISHSNLSLIMSSQRNVTFDFCVGIAKAFRVRPEKVLSLAGLLPPDAGTMDRLTEEEAELVELYRALPRAYQVANLETFRSLVNRLGKEE